MRFIVLKKKQVPHLGIYGDRQMACRRRKHNPYWSGRYLLETKPDLTLVSIRNLSVGEPVAVDHNCHHMQTLQYFYMKSHVQDLFKFLQNICLPMEIQFDTNCNTLRGSHPDITLNQLSKLSSIRQSQQPLSKVNEGLLDQVLISTFCT